MALLAKINPSLNPPIQVGTVDIHAPGFKGAVPEPGDEVFVWTSQNQGGVGLAALGIVAQVTTGSFQNASNDGVHDEYVATLRIVADDPDPITNDELEPVRNVRDGTPISEIGHVAYYHSHNKFAALSNDAADFLRRRFV